MFHCEADTGVERSAFAAIVIVPQQINVRVRCGLFKMIVICRPTAVVDQYNRRDALLSQSANHLDERWPGIVCRDDYWLCRKVSQNIF